MRAPLLAASRSRCAGLALLLSLGTRGLQQRDGGLRLQRLRVALAAGYSLRRGAFELRALAAVTVEPFDTAAGFGVNLDTGRFGHHPHYVKQAAAAAGLTVKQEARVQLYPQFTGLLFVLGK